MELHDIKKIEVMKSTNFHVYRHEKLTHEFNYHYLFKGKDYVAFGFYEEYQTRSMFSATTTEHVYFFQERELKSSIGRKYACSVNGVVNDTTFDIPLAQYESDREEHSNLFFSPQ